MIPENAAAETIQALQKDSGFYQEQIDKNSALIAQLEPLAEWSEPVVEESTVPLEAFEN
jgi:hypothetical protein